MLQSETQQCLVGTHDGFSFCWKITIQPDRFPAVPKVTCNHCLGRGRVDSGYDYDQETCWKCRGTGKVDDPSFTWKPTPPEDLLNALRSVYKEYWNKQQNEDFKLT